jgi:DNA-binding beta-propeller fold protein YncE
MVTISLGNAQGATLGGTTTKAAVNGVATFSDLYVRQAGTAYELLADSTGLLQGTSGQFDVTPGPTTALAITAQPSSGAVHQTLSQLDVQAVDAYGNVVPMPFVNVTVALGMSPGGAALGGTTQSFLGSGTVSFTDLNVDQVGTYTLTASAPSLTGATTSSFDVGPNAPAKLAFFSQPSSGTSGVALSPAVGVAIEDAYGNVTTSGAQVTLSLSSGPPSSHLGGTLTAMASSGLASFADLTLDLTGSYTLQANSGIFAGIMSAPIAIAAGTPTQLSFTTQPSDSPLGGTIAPAVRVTALDAAGNVATNASGPVTMALGTSPGGSHLSGTLSQPLVSGVATFADLSVDVTGAYTLAASMPGGLNAQSASFQARNLKLAFQMQPTNTNTASTFSVTVAIQDNLGGATTSTATVTLGFAANPGSATLQGVTSVAAVSGLATFTGLSIQTPGNGYQLSASSTGIAGTTSNTFNVQVIPAKIAFVAQPKAPPPTSMLRVKVAIQDAAGNLVSTATDSVTLSLGVNPTATTLGGTLTVAAVNGIATFTDVHIDPAGTGYTLKASDGAFPQIETNPFNVQEIADDGVGHLLPDGTMDFPRVSEYMSAQAVTQAFATAIDKVHHRLFVADGYNNRVLMFQLSANDDFTGKTRAAIGVIGKGDVYSTTPTVFSTPTGLAYDPVGDRLLVSNSSNCGVKVFNLANMVNGALTTSSLNIGSCCPSSCACGTFYFGGATGLAYDSGSVSGLTRVFFSDPANSRVMIYDLGSHSYNVLGQSLTTNCGAPAMPSASVVSNPQGLAYDEASSRLFVTDKGYHRTMVFDLTTVANGMAATIGIGAPSLTGSGLGTDAAHSSQPFGVTYDPTTGQTFVAELGNQRVTVFPAPLSTGMSATVVLGQTGFGAPTTGTSSTAIHLFGSAGLAVSQGLLWLPDSANHRELVFPITTPATGEAAIDGLGHINPDVMDFNVLDEYSSRRAMPAPQSVALDKVHHRLFVGSGSELRMWNLSATNDFSGADRTADVVMPLSAVWGIAVDSVHNRLFVSTAGYRVFIYDASTLSDSATPIHELGGPDYNTSTFGSDAHGNFTNAYGLAYDSARDWLFVSDLGQHRILVFDVGPSLVDGEEAMHLLGQTSWTLSTTGVIDPVHIDQVRGIDYDPATHRLYAAIDNQDRVMVWDTTTLSDGQPAVDVIGATDLMSAGSLLGPCAVAFDAATGRAYVVQEGAGALVFDQPTMGASATSYVGQYALTPPYGTGVYSVLTPYGIAVDSTRQEVYLTDQGNNRVFEYPAP